MGFAAPVKLPSKGLPCPVEADTNDGAGRDGREKRLHGLSVLLAFHDFAILTCGDPPIPQRR
jgi:hypothetical protein